MNNFSVMFHHFHGKGHPKAQGSISGDEFERILDHIQSNHWLVDSNHWGKLILGQTPVTDVGCISLDDGLRCQFDIAFPILEKYGIKAFWFIPTAPLTGKSIEIEAHKYWINTHYKTREGFYKEFFKETPGLYKDCGDYLKQYPFYTDDDRRFRYIRDKFPDKYKRIMIRLMDDWEPPFDKIWLGKEQIQQLDKEGHVIGLHSHNHPPNLKTAEPGIIYQEYMHNYAELSSIINQKIIASSTPCSSYNETTKKAWEILGIELGFRATMDDRGFNKYQMPRLDHAILAKEIL